MSAIAPIAQAVLADPALLEHFLEDVDLIVQAVERLHETAHALTAPKPEPPAAPAPIQPGVALMFDITPAALENADAETLVALRKDHSAVDHPFDGCFICALLERRLGSARP